MKAFLQRLVVIVVLVVLIATFCFQNVSLAIGGEGDAESRTVAAHQRPESGGGGGGGSGWRFPNLFWRPSPGSPVIPQVDKIAGAALKDRDRPTGGAGGRDAGQRERNQESGHEGFGGPQ